MVKKMEVKWHFTDTLSTKISIPICKAICGFQNQDTKIRMQKPIQDVSSPTPRNHYGAHPLLFPCVLIDKVWPSVARLSQTLVIVGGSHLRPPVIRGPLWDKGQRMERILICRDELILTGSVHTFYTWGLAYWGGLCSGPWHSGVCESMFLYNSFCSLFAKFVPRTSYLWLSHDDGELFISLCSHIFQDVADSDESEDHRLMHCLSKRLRRTFISH